MCHWADALKPAVADAMAAAAAAISVLCDSTVVAAIMIAFAFEITSMTGRAERRVLGPGPGNVSADGITVAAVTTRISAVIARIVALRVVTEISRRPAVGGMAHVALFGRLQMRQNRVYLAGRDITVVAGIAIVGTVGIVSPAAANEGRGGMTG